MTYIFFCFVLIGSRMQISMRAGRHQERVRGIHTKKKNNRKYLKFTSTILYTYVEVPEFIFTLLFIYVYTRLRFIYICVKSPSQSRIHYVHRRNVSPQRFLGRSSLVNIIYIYIYKVYVIIIISITREEEKNYRPLR